MARNGYRIFDSDTHVGPSMDILEQYLDPADREKVAQFEQSKRVQPRTGQVTYPIGARAYNRRIGLAEPEAAGKGEYMKGFTGAHKGQEPDPRVDHDPSARIRDLDQEGVDVNLLLPSGWFGAWTTIDDLQFEQAMYRAYHRWMADYCGAYPTRLTGVILLSGRDIESSLKELHRVAKEPWAMGVFAYAPYGMPLDHPALEPYWAAAQEYDLAITLHTFTVMPPYAPGGLDNWDNLWLQRSAAHPWCGMRNMASLIGSGVLDRYPDLRVGLLEAGHSWLPFWMKRLDEHAKTIASALPPLQHLPGDYVTGGRYFQSIEIPEGEALTKSVIDLIGDHVLMYASDYPHGESWFPKSVDTVLEWDLDPEVKRKLFWDNAVRYYRRYRAD